MHMKLFWNWVQNRAIKLFSPRSKQAFNCAHSNWIIVCHYVGTTLSITCLAVEGENSERIKTFICMIMFALPTVMNDNLIFGQMLGGQIAAAENETLVAAPSDWSFFSVHGNLFKFFLANHAPWISSVSAHTIDTAHNDDMTVYGMVAFEPLSKGPWTGSMIRIQNRWSLESRDKWTHHETRNLLGGIRESTDFIDTSECIPLELCDLCSQTATRYGHAAERKKGDSRWKWKWRV